jgi:hypothetical protein
VKVSRATVVSDLGRVLAVLRGSDGRRGATRFSLMRDGKTYYRSAVSLARFVPASGWAQLLEFPRYLISESGEVGRLRDVTDNGNGYLYVLADGARVGLHRLVCRAFYGEPPFEGADAAHEDRDTANNHACNLRWDTRLGNMADTGRHGSFDYRRKLTDEDVMEIRRRWKAAAGRAELAREYPVSAGTIYKIATGTKYRRLPMPA